MGALCLGSEASRHAVIELDEFELRRLPGGRTVRIAESMSGSGAKACL
jgi:NOL1/NOP2/fmu family ribosome biogenesis protein